MVRSQRKKPRQIGESRGLFLEACGWVGDDSHSQPGRRGARQVELRCMWCMDEGLLGLVRVTKSGWPRGVSERRRILPAAGLVCQAIRRLGATAGLHAGAWFLALRRALGVYSFPRWG